MPRAIPFWRASILAAAALLFLPFGAYPTLARGDTPSEMRSFPLPLNRSLELSVPTTWHHAIDSAREFPTIRFSPSIEERFDLSLIVMWKQIPDKKWHSPKAIRSRLKEHASRNIAQFATVEDKVDFRKIETDKVIGYFYSINDPGPPPDHYSSMTEGEAIVGELVLHFIIMTDDPFSGVIATTLDMIKHAKQGVPPISPPSAASLRKIEVPQHPWAIVASLEGFALEERTPIYITDSKTGRYSIAGWKWLASNDELDVLLSISVEEPDIEATPLECRTLYRQKHRTALSGHKQDEKLSERSGMGLLQYMVPRAQGRIIDQHHVHAFLSEADSCIVIHMSKVSYSSQDWPLFENILQSIRVVPVE